MIKKIKTISNFAVFDNFDWDNCTQNSNGQPLLFEKLNILYGRNYSGKTTLSRILRTLETYRLPEKYENPQFEIILDDGSKITQTTIDSAAISVRVFNEDFVRANLRFLIDPDGEIAPFAILGANNSEIEKAIKDLKTEIGDGRRLV
jgi:wobble nucleotide-excising tRNase